MSVNPILATKILRFLEVPMFSHRPPLALLRASVTVAILVLGANVFAAPPDSVRLQGVLREETGGLQDGLFDFRVRLLENGVGFFDEAYTDVVVQSGVFDLELRPSSGSLAAVLRQHPAAQVEITVNGEVLSAAPLASTPYALYCAHADTAENALQLDGVPASDWARRAELADGDATTAPVSWRDLSTFPSDCPSEQFVVGVDPSTGAFRCGVPAGGGDITSVAPGLGLTGGGNSDNVTLAVDTTVIQARVSACPAGQAISAVDENGDATCVATGISGIADGSVVARHIAGDTITAAQIGPEAVGSSELAAASVTRAHLASDGCASGQTLVHDGVGWVCAEPPTYSAGPGLLLQDGQFVLEAAPLQAPKSNKAKILTAGPIKYSSTTVNPDGQALVAYQQTGAADEVKLVKCANSDCSTSSTVTIATVAYDSFPSIAVGGDGLPIISYAGSGATVPLQVTKCTSPDCSSNVQTTVYSQLEVGVTSLAIGLDGLAVVAFYVAGENTLRVAKCQDAECSSSAMVTVDPDAVSRAVSIGVGVDGMPFVAYDDGTSLLFIRCTSASCATFSAPVTIDSIGNSQESIAVTVGNDGLPLVAYRDYDNGQVKVAKCSNSSCSSSTISIVGSGGSGRFVSISMGADGLATVAYSDGNNVRTAKCTTSSCSSVMTSTVDGIGSAEAVSVVLPTDGIPLVAYADSALQRLKALKCANPFCLANWSRR
ncbi:MAG: hypothetical protein AB2A00_40600 [Myxococcota bacterium]